MLKRVFCCFCLCLTASLALAEDIPRYKIRAFVDTKHKIITASQEVTFTNISLKPIEDVYFHVYSNRQYSREETAFMLRYASYFKVDPPARFTQSQFHISHLKVGSSEGKFSFEGKDQTLLHVSLGEALAPGASITIAIDFNVTIPHAFGRFGWYQDVIALARWYPILSVLGADGWNQSPFYPFHRPFFSDSSYYTMDLTIPSKDVVIHSGDLIQEDRNVQASAGGNLRKLHIENSKPIREFAMAISPSYQLQEEEKDGITFKAYYLGNNSDHAKLAIQNAQDLMTYYTKRFGPYPYKVFSIAPVHLAYGGEQMPNMIFIDTRVFEMPRFLDRYFDFLIAHETGHQWFYNLVGSNNYSQMWLEEGINSYFLMEYLSDKYGDNAPIIPLPHWAKVLVPELTFKRAQDLRYKMAVRVGYESPVIGKLSSFKEPSSIFTFTYGKGSKVLQMLKSTVGEESFDRLFQKIFEQYRFKNLDIKDFQRIAQEESSKDLQSFFDQWLHSTKSLDAKVDHIHGQSIYVSHAGGIQMPIEGDIHYQDGTQDHFVWDGVRQKDIISIPANKAIRYVGLDEQQDLLDVERVNNFYPRKVYARLIPFYHGLYDIPVFLKDDGYNWMTGPAMADGIGLKTSFQKPYDYSVYAQSGYSIGDQLQTTREGFEIKNILHSQTAFGFEAMQRVDYDHGEDDLNSQKMYLRRELWPAPYSLSDVNDHITLYVVRNRTPSGSFLTSESIQNTSYLKHDEAIVGTALHLDRAGPHPDVRQGYAADVLVENSGHWAGATQTFTRASMDGKYYHPVTEASKMAYRLKYGWGSSDDKNLYELGGMDGLRGFDRKTIRGSDMLLGSAEYRFPLLDGLKLSTYERVLTLNKISGVAFLDVGQAWRDNFDEGKFHKDLGLGLRFHVSVGSFLENVLVRVDIARAIDEPKEGTHAWLGVNQAF